jgi:hypothetical protein
LAENDFVSIKRLCVYSPVWENFLKVKFELREAQKLIGKLTEIDESKFNLPG